MSALDDRELMELVKTGSHPAFASLVRRHAESFYRISYRYVADRPSAEDVVQQAFLKLWEYPDKYHADGASFKVWFAKVVVNMSIDCLRRRKTVSYDGGGYEFEDGRESAEAAVIRQSQERRLEQAIARLPLRQKTALNLGVYEEMPHAEVARIMNLKIGAVQSLIMRAKDNIRKYVGVTANAKQEV